MVKKSKYAPEKPKEDEPPYFLDFEDPLNFRFRPNIILLKRVYSIPTSVTMSHYRQALRYCHHDFENPKSVMVTAYQIAAGCRFPLTSLDRDVLNHYKLAPGQVNCNFWRIMRAFNNLNGKDDYKVTLEHIRQTYRIRASDVRASVPYYHFVKRPGRATIIMKLPESDKPWADYPIIVSDLVGGDGDGIINPLLFWKFNTGAVNTDTKAPKPRVTTPVEEILGDNNNWPALQVYTQAKNNGDEFITNADLQGVYTLPVCCHYKCPKPDSVKGKSTTDRHHSAPISKKKSSLTISVIDDNPPQKKSKVEQAKSKVSADSSGGDPVYHYKFGSLPTASQLESYKRSTLSTQRANLSTIPEMNSLSLSPTTSLSTSNSKKKKKNIVISDRSEEDTDSDQPSKVTALPNNPLSNMDKTDFDLSGFDIDFPGFTDVQVEPNDLAGIQVDIVPSDVLPLVPACEQKTDVEVNLIDSEDEPNVLLEQTVVPSAKPQDCLSKKRKTYVEDKSSASSSLKTSAIFSSSLTLDGRAVTMDDSVPFIMTQHTTLPNDDAELKSSFLCLLSQLKDVGGEIIGQNDTKVSNIKSLEATRDQLIKDNELLKVSAEEAQRCYKELNHDFEQFKVQTANSRKSYEDQLAVLRLKVNQTAKNNIDLEADKLSLTARYKLAESRISTLDGELLQLRTDSKQLSLAHECAVKGMNEKLLSLEASIKQKDADCEAWYKDMDAKAKAAVVEKVRVKVAAIIKSVQSKSLASLAPPASNP